jgi:hypothetical protein
MTEAALRDKETVGLPYFKLSASRTSWSNVATMDSRCATLSDIGPFGERLGSPEVYGDDIGYKLCSQELSSDTSRSAGTDGEEG